MTKLQNYAVVDVAIGTPEPPGLSAGVRMYVADEVDARIALMQMAVGQIIGCGAFIPTGEANLYFERSGVLYKFELPAEFAEIIGSKP